MAYQPNEQQLMAINEFDSDLLVNAGAGTGKTSVLTDKYLKLLEERRAEVTEIVAITFTKKAAVEMNDRIQQKMREKYEQAVDPEKVKFWRTQLDKMEKARITTFHSLCLSLIREYPVEAGIPPAAGVLDAGEENLRLQQAVTVALAAALGDTGLDTEMLNQWVFECGWEAFGNGLIDLYRKVRESGLDFPTVATLTSANLERGLAGNPVEVCHLSREIAELLAEAPTPKLTDRAKELIGNFEREWPEYRQSLTETGELELLLPMLAGIKKALPKNLPNCLKERVAEIHRLVDAYSVKLLDREALQRIPLLRELLERLDQEFTKAKLADGLLDFTDQQLLARDLLRKNPLVTEKIRQGIRYIMVDEFQDTNSLQSELIDLLTGEGYHGGRLMAVGDIKQSIYRFRGAEAGVILSWQERLQAGRGLVIPLTRNYRSSQLVIRFINQLAQRMFAGENFAYEALESTQSDNGAQLELLYTGGPDLLQQARLVARRIAGLVRESQTTEQPIGYQDIVLLFRASTALPLFGQALQELGIPYYAASGGQFYRRSEIIDQLNLLRLVRQRYDGVALSGLLLSPYVGLTEEQLVLIGTGQPLVEQFYARETFGPELSDAVQERLFRFREVIAFLQENRELFDIAGIIRLALERLDYRELLWTLPSARRRLANLEKLLVKADEFAAKGYHQLTEFLAYIQDLETIAVKEGEAQTQAESSNAVRLMTIHRSKGLEFPVVILPDLDRRFVGGGRELFRFHKEVGIGFKIAVENSEPGETSLWRRIKEQEHQEETAELKRVLYVALTRVKRRLILVGSGASASKGDTLATGGDWMKWLELLLPKVAAATTQLDFDGIPLQVTRDLPEEARPEKGQTTLLDVYAAQLDASLLMTETRAAVAAAVMSPSRPIVNLKVSGVLTYKACPRRFYLQYCLKLPEIAVAAPLWDGEGPADAYGAQIGVFLHQAVRLKPQDVWPELLWRQTFGDLTGAAMVKLHQDVQLMWQNFGRSEFSRAGQIWDEVPFQLKLGENLRVEGRFDRLLQHSEGELVLVDYKTHRTSRAKVAEMALSYFWQLQLYSLAIEAIWGRKPDRAMLYFAYPDTAVAVPIDEAALDATVSEVKTLGRLLAEPGRQLSDFPRREAACEHCSYRWFCQKTSG
jgi:ATP-dependent helicase/nuclease subunit A